MTYWLEWARGPAFRFALVFMLLGIARLVLLNAIGLVSVYRRAGDRRIPWKSVLTSSARWLVPFRRGKTSLGLFTAVSVVFHITIIVTPLFLGAHIMLWDRGLGLSWPALSQDVADVLTLAAVVTAFLLFFHRAFSRTGRSLSRPQDYFFPLLIGVTCLAGYLAMHPRVNPIGYEPTLLVHILTGNVALALLPFSKLSHAVLFPFSQLISELGWHLAKDSGRAVAHALGKEGEAI